MRNDQFTKLYLYMDARFADVYQRLDQNDLKMDKIMNAVVAYAKQTETYMQEMLALGVLVNRHDGQIRKIAKAGNVKLAP